MDDSIFQYKGNDLHCHGVYLQKITREMKTPFYVYSEKAIIDQLNAYKLAFAHTSHLICFSVKSLSNISILKLISSTGVGFDIVSGGELYRLMKIDADPKKIVFSGVGKDVASISAALDYGIMLFNVESASELTQINRIAGKMKRIAPIGIRVNPAIDAKTHGKIATGRKDDKFGIDFDEAIELIVRIKEFKNVELMGIDCHIGSQITELAPIIRTSKKIKACAEEIRKMGISLRYLDVGGGLGIRYRHENPPSISTYAKAVIRAMRDLDLKIIVEPGRSIVGNAGALITRVLYKKKKKNGKGFIIVDAGMNDLARPSLYNAYHHIIPLKKRPKKSMITADIVGPVCESSDVFGKARDIEEPFEGDYLAILSAGAYGSIMASNYGSRPRGAEILVTGKKFNIIRQAETFEDLVVREL
jgi:diaminopimelate decarboxylase